MAKLINGNGNPAIYAAEDADLIASLAGNVTCIANVGNKYAATEEDATTIRLDDGVIITKEGRRIQLEAGESDTFYIPTGTSDQTNYYIIGYKLVQNPDSTQVAEQFVKKMNSSSETITEDTFRSGATEVYVSVYRVTQVGFTIDSISGLLPKLLDNASIKDNIDQINSDLSDITLSIPNILDFGVKGDGITDNTAALNNLSAGVYYIPNGTYLYSANIELTDIILIGQSKDGVILKNMPTVTYQEIQLTNSGIENATIEDRSTPVANVCNVRLLGDRSYIKNCNINLSEEGHIGVSVDTNGIIEKCIFDGSTNAMFGIYAITAAISVKVSDCTFTDFWLNAIYTEGLKLEVDNCILHDNHHQETPNGGGQICVTGEALGNTTYDIRNCYIYDPAGNSTYAIETFNATGVIASNLLKGNSTAPTIRVQQSQNDVIIGNTIINGVQGIQIVGGATQKANTVIEGNTFKTPVQSCIYMASDVKDVVAIGNNVNGNTFYNGNTRKAFLNYQCAGATLFSITTGNSVEIDIPMDITRASGGVMCELTLYYDGAFHNVIGRLMENGFASFVNDGTATIVYNNATKKLTITGTGSYIEGWYRFY